MTKNVKTSNNTLFFIVKGFFLETKFISDFMIVVNVSLALSTVALFPGVFVSLILLRKFMFILSGRHSSSHENKSWQSLYIFLKPWCMKVRCFKLTWQYASISSLILCSFDSGLSQDSSLDLKKCELTIILDFLPQSCVLKKN